MSGGRAGRPRHGGHRRAGKRGRGRWSLVLVVAVLAAVALRAYGAAGLDKLHELATPSPVTPAAAAPTPVVPVSTPSPSPTPAPRTTAAVPSAGRIVPLPAAPRPAPVTFTYSVRSAGPVGTDLAVFAATARQVYASPRGWSAGSRMAFREVASGGDFTLWIATPAQVEAFGSVCDRTWSCRNGRNVIVNEARWTSGSPTGVLAGDLAAYRAMVVNHETGHWLGLSHRDCPAPGALAPLMQQQSIALQGCRANPWPTAAELAAAAARIPRPSG